MSQYAILYIRSAVTTANVGPKLEACRRWANQRGLRVAAVFVEFASGLDPDLPVLAQAVERARNAKACLVCWSGADIARSPDLYAKRMAQCTRLGVGVSFVLQ